MGSSPQEFGLGLSSVMFGCLFAEEVVSVEKPVGPDSCTQHPKGSDSPEPPLVGFHNEVSIVEHLTLLLTQKYYFLLSFYFFIYLNLLSFIFYLLN